MNFELLKINFITIGSLLVKRHHLKKSTISSTWKRFFQRPCWWANILESTAVFSLKCTAIENLVHVVVGWDRYVASQQYEMWQNALFYYLWCISFTFTTFEKILHKIILQSLCACSWSNNFNVCGSQKTQLKLQFERCFCRTCHIQMQLCFQVKWPTSMRWDQRWDQVKHFYLNTFYQDFCNELY